MGQAFEGYIVKSFKYGKSGKNTFNLNYTTAHIGNEAVGNTMVSQSRQLMFRFQLAKQFPSYVWFDILSFVAGTEVMVFDFDDICLSGSLLKVKITSTILTVAGDEGALHTCSSIF